MPHISTARKIVALALITFIHASLMGAINQTAGLGPRIIADLGITTTEFASIMTISFLTGAIFGIPFGIFADKTRVRWAVGGGLVLAAIGAWMRPFVDNYTMLFLSNFIIGFGLAGLNANSVKFLSAWFGNQITIGMGIYVGGAGIGITFALQMPQFFDSWNACYMVFAVILTVAAVLWLLLGSTPKGVTVHKDDLSVKDFVTVAKIPAVWISSLSMACAMAAGICVASFMTTTLVQGMGVPEVDANNVSSLNSLVNIVGCFVLPIIIDRLNSIRLSVLVLSVLCAGCVLIGWYSTSVVLASIFFSLEGFLTGGVPGPIKASLGLIKPVVASRGTMGAAGGLQTTVQNVGAYVIPTLIISPLAAGDFGIHWILTAILMCIGGVLLYTIPKKDLINTGKNASDEELANA